MEEPGVRVGAGRGRDTHYTHSATAVKQLESGETAGRAEGQIACHGTVEKRKNACKNKQADADETAVQTEKDPKIPTQPPKPQAQQAAGSKQSPFSQPIRPSPPGDPHDWI
jgi:hypothetical protein